MKKISYIEDFQSWKDEFTFFIPIKVRFSETDMFGHVNNVSPFIYFEEGRIAFMEHLGIFRNLSESSVNIPVVADLQCDYHKQMYFHDALRLFVKVNYIGNSSMDLHYLIVNEGNEICTTGRGRVVQINAKTGKSVPFDEEQKKALDSN